MPRLPTAGVVLVSARMQLRAPLQPQAARNQKAIEQVEQSLHEKREERGWDGAFEEWWRCR